MNDRVRFVEHKGVRVLLLDASNCAPEVTVEVMKASRELARTQPLNSLRTVVDVTNSHFNDASSHEIKISAEANKPYARALAVVGVRGLKKIVLNVVIRASGREIPIFETREEAMDWLATR